MADPAAGTAALVPPDFGETLGFSWKCLLAPREVFGNLRNLPVPGYGLMVGNALLWSTAAFAINVGRFLVENPGALASVRVLPMALATGLAYALVVPAAFVAAAVLQVLALLSGGRDGYARSFQTVSLLSSLAPLSAVAMALPVPLAWAAPPAYGVLLAALSTALMHGAPVVQALVVFFVAGGLGAAGAWRVHQKLARLQASVAAFQSAVQAQGESASARPARPMTPEQMLQVQRDGLDLLKNLQGLSADPKAAGRPSPQQAQQMRQLAQTAVGQLRATNPQMASGLDMLLRQTQSGAPQSPEQQQQTRQAAQQVIAGTQQVFNDPKTTQGMTPEQLRQFRELQGMVGSLSAGEAPQGQDLNLMMSRIQQMAAGMQPAPGLEAAGGEDPPVPKPKRAKKRRPPPPGEP